MSRTISPGRPYPLGAVFDGAGANFSVFSGIAERVELCLFDATGQETRVELPEMDGHAWHGYVPGVGPGQRYGYRVHGPWDPAAAKLCNPRKLLLDPYARAIEGSVVWRDAVYSHVPSAPARQSRIDSAPAVPRSLVIDNEFDWGDDRRPHVSGEDSVIYEVHVRGFTRRHPNIPEPLRGTYAGLAHPAAIEHLQSLGVTALELMPVHQFLDDRFLVERGLHNYWGYSSIGFFAPHSAYSSGGQSGHQVTEFKTMVRTLHEAGLEVLLDVVYNHTGEGGPTGPTLSLRGFDSTTYYRLNPHDPSQYVDITGTGNTLDIREPHTLQLVMDSLRYWATEMHVDGFRFDLATSLARDGDAFDRGAAFFDIIRQDPVLRSVKLIAEPWDVGEHGYQVGGFPAYWSEWNARYRDTIRDLWRGEPDMLHDLGRRLTGSADLYAAAGRRPSASVNFVTAHDGFTLADLVSYNDKHNEANGDNGTDGESMNRSWNCGAEGPSSDPAIVALRARQQRNFLATLLLSQGMAMLSGGDEIGRTQQGNNNGYCHDSELSWHDWTSVDGPLLAFTQQMVALRRAHPTFRRRHWFDSKRGVDSGEEGAPDIEWFGVSGGPMEMDDWHTHDAGVIAVFLSGDGLTDMSGLATPDDAFYLLINATSTDVRFKLPRHRVGTNWSLVLNTAAPDPFAAAPATGPGSSDAARGGTLTVKDHALVLLQIPR